MRQFKTTLFNTYKGLLLGLICLLIPISSYATSQNNFQSHDSLYQLALEHLKQKTDQKLFNPQFHIQNLSQHIKLAQCQVPITLRDRDPQKFTGRNTLRISCSKPEWNIFLSTTITGELPVIVSTQGIHRQAVIKPEDIKRILVAHSRARKDGFTQVEQVIGLRAKRSIGPNRILTARLVQPPYLVLKNKQVTLISQVGSIKIETKGLALKSGVKQEQIPVKNLSSKKTVKGTVIAPNTVRVP